MTTNAADALERLERTVTDMRAEARDASEDGEDMSVMREWANGIAKSIRSLRKILAERQGEAVVEIGEDDGVPFIQYTKDFITHKWATGTKLYTHPAPAAVDDAMVERALQAFYDGPWVDGREQELKLMRSVLVAALQNGAE